MVPKGSQGVLHYPAAVLSIYLTFSLPQSSFLFALGLTFIESNQNDEVSCQQDFLTTASSILVLLLHASLFDKPEFSK